jgi:hypothetical protein
VEVQKSDSPILQKEKRKYGGGKFGVVENLDRPASPPGSGVLVILTVSRERTANGKILVTGSLTRATLDQHLHRASQPKVMK